MKILIWTFAECRRGAGEQTVREDRTRRKVCVDPPTVVHRSAARVAAQNHHTSHGAHAWQGAGRQISTTSRGFRSVLAASRGLRHFWVGMRAPHSLTVREHEHECNRAHKPEHAHALIDWPCCAVQVTASQRDDRSGPSRAVRACRRRDGQLHPGARGRPTTSSRRSAALTCFQVRCCESV